MGCLGSSEFCFVLCVYRAQKELLQKPVGLLEIEETLLIQLRIVDWDA